MSGRREVLLTDTQWEKVKRFIPMVANPKDGRPRAGDRSCFEGSSGPAKRSSPERFAGKISISENLFAATREMG